MYIAAFGKQGKTDMRQTFNFTFCSILRNVRRYRFGFVSLNSFSDKPVCRRFPTIESGYP